MRHVMAEAPHKVTDPTLAELLRRLVAVYQPERAYLFDRRNGRATRSLRTDACDIVPASRRSSA